MKNHCSPLGRLLKKHNNGTLPPGTPFFAPETLTLFHHANQESDDVTDCATQNCKTQNKEYLWKY